MASLTASAASDTTLAISYPTTQDLGTAFDPPASCHDFFSTTTIDRTQSPTLVTVFASVPSGHPSCQPTGFDYLPDYTRSFVCYDCVCPKDWTAYDLRIAGYTSNWATCCSKGFTPSTIPGISILGTIACMKTTIAITDNSTIMTISAHPVWQAIWFHSRDQSLLTPAPPEMIESCNKIQIRTWTPGSMVSATDRVDKPCGGPPPSPLATPGYAFLAIGLPIIAVVAVVAIWVVYRIKGARKCKREKMAVVAEGAQRNTLSVSQ